MGYIYCRDFVKKRKKVETWFFELFNYIRCQTNNFTRKKIEYGRILRRVFKDVRCEDLHMIK